MRETIIKLLTETELANVSRDEGTQWLIRGDEFVDLANLDRGIQKVKVLRQESNTSVAKPSVSVPTWSKVVTAMGAAGLP